MNKNIGVKFFAKTFLICLLLASLIVGFLRQLEPVSAVAQGDGKLFYGVSANTTPQAKDYTATSNTFGTIGGTVAGATPLQSVLKANPTKNEMVSGYVNSAGTLQIMCYNGTTWSNEWSATVGGTGTTRRFDIGIEKTAGDTVVLYSTNASASNELAYRTKHGSSACGTANWSSATNYSTVRTTGVVQWVRLEASPVAGSNTIGAAWLDNSATTGAGGDLSAMEWTGSSWAVAEPAAALETNTEYATAVGDTESFDVAMENTTGNMMVVWGVLTTSTACTAGSNCIRYSRYTSSWLAATAVPTVADGATSIDMAANPKTASNEIAFAAIDNGTNTTNANDLSLAYWSGSAWTGTANVDTATATPPAGGRVVAMGWLTSGATTRSVAVYYDSAATNVGWYVGNAGTFTVQTDWVPTPVFGAQTQYKIIQDPFNTDRFMLLVSDANSDVFAKRLVMTSVPGFTWTNADGGVALEANGSSNAYKFWAFAYNQFIPARNLTISAPGSMTLNGVGIGGTAQISTTNFPSAITVSDNTTTGWSSTATCTNFTGSGTINVTNLNFAPGSLTVNSGSATGVSAGSSHTFTGTSDPTTIMNATSGNGNGSYSVTPTLQLTVPAWQATGSYSATITETVS